MKEALINSNYQLSSKKSLYKNTKRITSSNIPIRIGETIKGDDILEKDELLDIDSNVTNTIRSNAILSENGSNDIENILTIGRLIDEATTFKGTGHLLFCFSPLFLLG